MLGLHTLLNVDGGKEKMVGTPAMPLLQECENMSTEKSLTQNFVHFGEKVA